MPRVLVSQTSVRLADTPTPFRVINRKRCSVESRLKIVRWRARTTLRARCHFARSRIDEETFNFHCLRARARHNGGLRRAPSFSRLGISSPFRAQAGCVLYAWENRARAQSWGPRQPTKGRLRGPIGAVSPSTGPAENPGQTFSIDFGPL